MEVKIEGFWNKQNDGRREYVKGRTLNWVVDSDRFSVCDTLSILSDEISWGSCQTVRLWVFDKNEGKDVSILSESQIPEMFRMYQTEKTILLNVVVCDTDGKENPCTPCQPTLSVAPVNQSQVESSQGCNTSSQLAPSIARGSQVGASQTSQIAGEPSTFDDPDPDPDEYVGVNDEDIYCHGDEAIHEEYIGPDSILEDEEASIDDAVDSERVIAFDPENPKIEVGELFPNVDVFKKSLKHFAIKNEFEVCTVKSDKRRFIGKCKDPSCPWRIHASRLQDNKTFMVCMHNLDTYNFCS